MSSERRYALIGHTHDTVGGVTDHGALTGLADDDHTQYFNQTRGDARYSLLGHNHDAAYSPLGHTHDDRYFTETESDARYSLLGHTHDYAPSSHTHSYLPLSGGTLTGALTVNVAGAGASASVLARMASGDANFALHAWNGRGTTIDSESASIGLAYQGTRVASLNFFRGGAANAILAQIEVNGNVGFQTDGTNIYEGGTALSSKYAALSHTHSTYVNNGYLNAQQIGDANAADSYAGVAFNYLQSGAANKPSGVDHALITLSYSNDFYSFQLAGDWRTNILYTRKQQDGVWSSWEALAKASEVLALTGGTISGNLGINTSSFTYATAGRGVVEINGSSTAIMALKTGDVARGYLYTQGTDMILRAETGIIDLSGTAPTRITTSYGYATLGCANGSFFHISTDGKPIWFGNDVYFNGPIRDYSTGLLYSRSDHTHGTNRSSIQTANYWDSLTTTNFRTLTFGSTVQTGADLAIIRWNNVPAPLGLSQYGTAIAWACSDTQGFVAMNYNTAGMQVGGGNGDNINWSDYVMFLNAAQNVNGVKTFTAMPAFNAGVGVWNSYIQGSGYADVNANTFYADGYGTMRFGQCSSVSTNVPTPVNNATFLMYLGSHVGPYGKQLYFTDSEDLWMRKVSAGAWSSWRRLASFEPGNDYLHAPAWIRLNANVGLYTDTNDYFYNRGGSGWNIRGSNTGATDNFLILQDGAGNSRGYLTWDSTQVALYSYDSGTTFSIASSGSYGAVSITGSKNGWTGIRLDSGFRSPYLMAKTDSVEIGLYNETDGWTLYFNGSGYPSIKNNTKGLAWGDWGTSFKCSRGTANPSGGSDGDVYYQYV